MNFRPILIVISFLILTNCDYKIANKSFDYHLSEIISSGDSQINYQIKNALTNDKRNQNKSLKIDINTKKNKTINEKNIRNKVIKYKIDIMTNVKYEVIEKDLEGSFKVSKSGTYDVAQKYSDTLKLEKKLIRSLVRDLANEIEFNLRSRMNDL